MARMQVLNTKGAAKRLGCSETWIHRLVSTGKLKAYIYNDNGRLVERKPDEKRPGHVLPGQGCRCLPTCGAEPPTRKQK